MKDPYTAYSELLVPAFEKISKLVNSRKHKELKELCNKAAEQVKSDKSLDANRYFPILKMVLETKNAKVVELGLYYVQKLISHGFMTGNCEDTCSYPEGPQITPTRYPRRMIDGIVESICNCVAERDDSVQLQVIKSLLTIVTSFNCEVHERTLLEAFKACYHIHITSKNLVNQTTAKASLTQMLHFVFQRMENFSRDCSQEAFYKFLSGKLCNMVDDVCLFEERSKVNPDCPLRSVPLVLNPNDPHYRKITQVESKNENNAPAGKFGWCVVCRSSADLYCKESRDPVCSIQCKKVHSKNIEAAERYLKSDEENEFLHDAVLIFRSICKLSLKEISASASAFTFKSKVLSLELILAVIDNPGQTFLSKKQFIDVIRQTLCESLLNNSVSSERTIFALSLSIFVALVNNFKNSLKAEIGIFMEHIFIKILESENSSYHQKLLVVEVFYRITQNPKTTLELFLNYDCDVEEKDIFARMIDMLSKIAVGKYKNELALQPQQESTLRVTALETITNIVTAQVIWLEKDFNKSENWVEEVDDSVSDISSDTTAVSLDQFEKNKQLKNYLVRAVAKFNLKPSSGIKFLAQNGYLDAESPQEIAAFLKFTPGINKTVLGEFLGEYKDLNLQVLYEFIDLHDFKGIDLVEALRTFLSSFRIPGEGQKIDRFMEKFAEKYCRDNPERFSSADAAYMLCFGIMMLQTDLHNPSIKNKMPVSRFVAMYKEVTEGTNLDAAYLEEIYNNVKENPFTLDEDEEARAKAEGKRKMYQRETELMLLRTQEIFKKGRKQTTYYTATDIEHIRTMFESLWHPLLATFSIVLEEAEEVKVWRLSIQGYLACIKVVCRFNMELEIEVFLSSLAKFTSLIYLNNQVTEKNIECMKALLEIAKMESNYLKGSWLHILKCLSKLDYLHLLSSGAQWEGTATESDKLSSESISAHIDPSELDYIFNMSVKLDNDAIVDFVTNLVEVSKEELWKDNPQTFSLQALVNVADVNMNRMRMVWTRVWKCLREHFSLAGLHSSTNIAVFAVDSLKQLAIKFLQKEELSNFHFQKDFLQPFEVIIKQTDKYEVKDHIVACMSTFIFTMTKNIKSGWHTILEVFTQAAKAPYCSLTDSAFQAIRYIVNGYLDLVTDNFQELVNCLSLLATSADDKTCLESVQMLANCTEIVKKQLVSENFWFGLLSGISKGVIDERSYVQTRSLEILFKVLNDNSEKFSQEQWKLIYSGVILPIFDDFQNGEDIDKDWVTTTCQQALLMFVSLVTSKYSQLKFLVNDFLGLLEKTAFSLQEHLANVSITTYKSLALSTGHLFDQQTWELYLTILGKMFQQTTPIELTRTPENSCLEFDVHECVQKCVIQLHLIGASKEILETHFSKMPLESLLEFTKVLEGTYYFAKDFNLNISLRQALWNAGFLKSTKSLPGIFKQEKEGLTVYLNSLFWLSKAGADVSQEIYLTASQLIGEASKIESLGSERKEEVVSLLSVVGNTLLPGLKDHLPQVLKHMGDQIVELVMVNDYNLRQQLKGFLLQALRFLNN